MHPPQRISTATSSAIQQPAWSCGGLRGVERFEEVARGLAEREALTPGERRQLEAYGAAMRAAGKLD
jgi:hypothetical protein